MDLKFESNGWTRWFKPLEVSHKIEAYANLLAQVEFAHDVEVAVPVKRLSGSLIECYITDEVKIPNKVLILGVRFKKPLGLTQLEEILISVDKGMKEGELQICQAS